MEGGLEQLTRTYIATLDIAISTNAEDSTLLGLSDNIRTLLKNGQASSFDEGWAILRDVPEKFKETLEHLCESGRTAVVEDAVQEYIPQYYELHLAQLGHLPKGTLKQYKKLVSDWRSGPTRTHQAHWPATVLLVTDEAFSRKHFDLFRLDMEPLSFFRRHRPGLFIENYANVHRGIELGDQHLPDDVEVFLRAGNMDGAREVYLKIVNGLRQTEPEEIDKRVVGLTGKQRQQSRGFAKMMLSSPSYGADNVLQAALAMAAHDTLDAEPAATAASDIEGSLQLAESTLASVQTNYGSERAQLVAQAQEAIVVSSNLLGNLPLTSIRKALADRVQNAQEQTGQWNSTVQENTRLARGGR